MTLKEIGFRPLYHEICAFELNDKLKNIAKDCPDVSKASHIVVYGYIDADKGLMLEVLGVGKQAPKYFYFKDPYEGESIALKASDYIDVEFVVFEELQPRFRSKYEKRIDAIKKFDATKELEETRELGFLDQLRDAQYPDNVKIKLIKTNCKTEEVMVKMTHTKQPDIFGILLDQPEQDFGLNKDEEISFNVTQKKDKEVVAYKEFDGEGEKISEEALEDGSLLKNALIEWSNDQENELKISFVFSILKSCKLCVPASLNPTEEAQEILDKLEVEGKDKESLSPEELKILDEGTNLSPVTITTEDGKVFLPVFSSGDEMSDDMKELAIVNMPTLSVLAMTEEVFTDAEGIALNPYSENLVIPKKLFDAIRSSKEIVTEHSCDDSFEMGKNQPFTNREDLALALYVGKMDVFNFALYQSKVPPIRGIKIINDTGDPIEGLSIKISSDFYIFKNYESKLPTIPSGKPIDVPDPRLRINGQELAGMTEAVTASITVELCKDNEVICGVRGTMKVLAYDQYQGGESYRDLLPVFVLPNHPVIPALMHDASDRLSKWGKKPSLEGYQSGNPNRVRELIAAAYAAIQKKNIVYAEPPASFSVPGQRIRTPEVIMEQRLGTCMDMTLLFAALVEAMGLHPILVLIKGHIFAGVWLKERKIEELKSSNVVIENFEELSMRINNGTDEMTFVECTSMCSGKKDDFEAAEQAAKFGGLDPAAFEYAIDVHMARICRINPMASRVTEGGKFQIEISDKNEDEITSAPTDLGLVIADTSNAKVHKITTKKELWESKLLDLSGHNMLLNLPLNSSVEPIMSSHIDELEDALSGGHEFNLLPVPEWIMSIARVEKDDKGKEKVIPWLPEAIKKYGLYEVNTWPFSEDFDFNEKFRQEYRNHRLYTFCNEKQLDRDLTSIYRTARSSQQENGVSSLYLAVGLLRWFHVGMNDPLYAPLILVPIEIVRKSANQGYALHARDEEPHFNTTLLELLKQEFNINIPGLDPLPTDESGTDIKRVFAMVRSALFTVPNWDVVETCVIGNFSFAQFAMWNDIHSASETFENSKIVRSLMKGHVDWDTTPVDVTDEKVYLPITVDDTQLKAIKMAAHGTTFVLHGPPGTGKSQTITGMIANLMAQGKSVLFVAEKMAALTVVQKRLASLGIGDFCLELHSDKANKKQVLTQLEKAVSVSRPTSKTEYEEYFNKTSDIRNKIDGYAEHLHKKHNCGYSLRELIALYETVRDGESFVRFDRDKVGELTNDDIKKHLPLISKLISAGNVIDGIVGHKLTGVGLLSYSADVRDRLVRNAKAYRSAISDAVVKGNRVAAIVGANIPQNQGDIKALISMIDLYHANKETEPLLLSLLKNGPEEAYSYFDQKDKVTVEEMILLNDWNRDFLSMDMSGFMAKHEAASKKFFGKGSAMAQVTSELQAYCLKQLTFEQIPGLLKQISEYQLHVKSLGDFFEKLSDNTKSLIKELPNRDEMVKAYDAAIACKKQAESFPGGIDAIVGLSADPENGKAFDELATSIAELDEAEQSFNSLLNRAENTIDEDWFNKETELCDYLIEHPSELKDWSLYNQVKYDCIAVGLLPVIEAYEYEIGDKDLAEAYTRGLYYALINNIISHDDILSCFSGATFNESIAHFKKLDDMMLDFTKKEIYYRLAKNTPSALDSPEIGMELNLLRKAIGSNARGMSIRNLFDRLPNIIKRLCPCMLMSPNSVAQYLAQDSNLFDVVIFDEASQLPTCKAIGALSRAKDAVIVGDPKQMPPTAFFSGAGPEVDDLALDDLDSILDDALALGIPSQHLQWHYRSTHESLIAFSNNSFYENKMYTFPSANDRERHVTAVHVDGVYNKSTNPKEAEAVVAEIVRRFNTPELKEQSIGVVTFNIKQQALIENLLAKQYQVNPELDVWANSGEDALFVKNLENVQGDERDVILFSIGYGPDEEGHISNNFGPINKAGGGKRLNVAFSRARVTMTIFTSMYSSDIKVTETSPDGLVAFRDFLKFAEGQDIQTASNADLEEKLAKAGIMQNICKAIENHGYQCVTMVGHSDFHIDIAVVDPTEPTKYMMAIMLDGDGYKNTKNTRDREIAQISVLKRLGWNLCRVWTIDWWDNRDKEINKVLNKLEELKLEAEKRAEERKAQEEELKAAEEARLAEEQRLREELENQSAEVIAEDEEAEREQQELAEQYAKNAEKVVISSVDDKVETVLEEKTAVEDSTTEKAPEENSEAVLDVKSSDESLIEETIKEEPSKEEPSVEEASTEVQDKSDDGIVSPIAYIFADVQLTAMEPNDFALSSNRNQIIDRIEKVASIEAPIMKDTLMKKVFSSFGVSKMKITEEAFEKALKQAKVKNTRYKGNAYCWNEGQDSKCYYGIRVTQDRSGDEISPQEIKNAICYVLTNKGSMEKDELIKETSLVFGYKRLGKNLESSLMAGLQWAKTNGDVAIEGSKVSLV